MALSTILFKAEERQLNRKWTEQPVDDDFNWHSTCISYTPQEYEPIINVIKPVKYVRLQINDSFIIVDKKLSHICETINDAKKILELNDDWDSDGALAISSETFSRAMKSLISYSEFVLKEHKVIIKSPHISPGRDGSIDLDWSFEGVELLITVLNEDDYIFHYYGDNGKNNKVIKGFLTNSQVDEDLAHWMRKL